MKKINQIVLQKGLFASINEAQVEVEFPLIGSYF